MGHCISVYLVRKSDLRNDKIESIIDSNEYQDIKFVELKEDILVAIDIPKIREFGKNKMVAYITTDYFGGPGYQTAKVYDNNKLVYDQSDEDEMDYRCEPINNALRMMGVDAKNNYDEFDTIGLSKYRSNESFYRKGN